jgi:bisphosphoglycerate-dependent phosphoglycerate mutase
MGKLIIARHQESEWNKLGKWTGTRDRHLTDYGFQKSEDLGRLLKGMKIDCAFASMQVRSIETLSCILNVCHIHSIPTEHSSALNERDYGDYTGKDKESMQSLLGEEEFKKLRRGWDYPIPNGESLKTVYDRVVPYFLNIILPKVNEDKNVLLVGHGNSMRALIKYIENISDEDIINFEFPFETAFIYELDKEGHMVSKELKQQKSDLLKNENSRTQILATIGPASISDSILRDLLNSGVDAVRLNFSWLDQAEAHAYIEKIRDIFRETEKRLPIIADLPGPRIQNEEGHTYDKNMAFELTSKDKVLIDFCIKENIDYIALSFVSSKKEIEECRDIVSRNSGSQKIIAKIERQIAIDNLHEIIESADAVMVARGDLGEELPIEKLPFIQNEIINKSKYQRKPVIVATQMLYSMVENPEPTRAEVTDVSEAVLQGADVLMLSDETAKGKYPVEAVKIMEKIILEAEQHNNSLHIDSI